MEAGLCGETGVRVQALVVSLLKHGPEHVANQLPKMAVHNVQGIKHKHMRVSTEHAQVFLYQCFFYFLYKDFRCQ